MPRCLPRQSYINGSSLRKKLKLSFEGERGIDLAGISKQWFHEFSEQFSNPNYGYLKTTNKDTLYINPSIKDIYDPKDYKSWYRLFGRIIAMALYHKYNLSTTLCRTFYKSLLNLPFSLEDLKDYDKILYKNLKELKAMDNVEDLYLNFTVTKSKFGINFDEELVPNGSDIELTNENREEYIFLIVEKKLTQEVKIQIDAIKMGFNEVLPIDVLMEFGLNKG